MFIFLFVNWMAWSIYFNSVCRSLSYLMGITCLVGSGCFIRLRAILITKNFVLMAWSKLIWTRIHSNSTSWFYDINQTNKLFDLIALTPPTAEFSSSQYPFSFWLHTPHPPPSVKVCKIKTCNFCSCWKIFGSFKTGFIHSYITPNFQSYIAPNVHLYCRFPQIASSLRFFVLHLKDQVMSS